MGKDAETQKFDEAIQLVSGSLRPTLIRTVSTVRFNPL